MNFAKISPIKSIIEKSDGSVEVYALCTAETVDQDNEICCFRDSIEAYRAWSAATTKANQSPSWGDVLRNHDSSQVAGRLVFPPEFFSDSREIRVRVRAIDATTGDQLKKGPLTGISQAGRYAYRRCSNCNTDIPGSNNYCPKCDQDVVVNYAVKTITALSFCDTPCGAGASFEFVHADGSREVRKARVDAREGEVISMKEHAKLYDREGDLHGKLAALHGEKADDPHTSPADKKFHQAMQKFHGALAETAGAHAELCRGSKEAAVKGVAGEFFERYGESIFGRGGKESVGI